MELKEWQALVRHRKDIASLHMRKCFEDDSQRFAKHHLKTGEILLDFSRNRITDQTLPLLCELARAMHLQEAIEALFSGAPLNITENRSALHTALRDPSHSKIMVNGKNIADEIAQTQEKMRDFVAEVHSGKCKGITGKPIRHIVNIGIGGSHLGPKMCTDSLKEFAVSKLNIHFISSVDEDQLRSVLLKIAPEETLFIVSSKSFSTIEPLTNAFTLKLWLKDKLGHEAINKHFIAITANQGKALEFGIAKENIFPLWDFVGGRYSIWSAIGLPLMLMIGSEQFTEFLQGANEIDKHFRSAEFSQNMPVLMALLGIWYTNFFGATAQAIAPYANRLRYLIPYLQQAEMESNGKCMDKNGHSIAYASGSIIFGEEGCDSQHSYLQLLHQGQHFIPVDFIISGDAHTCRNQTHQNILIASCLSQAQALMRGKTQEEAFDELIDSGHSKEQAEKLAPHKMIPGNKTSNILFLDRINPKNLGALIALYEHKIFVQSIIWNINAFDQWGVELGKQLLPDILHHVEGRQAGAIDSATSGLIQHLNNLRNSKPS